MKILYFFIALSCCTITAKTKDTCIVLQSLPLRNDLINTEEKITFDPETIQQYKEDADFDYVTTEPSDNWWTEFKTWLEQVIIDFFSKLFGDFELSGFWSFFFKVLLYIGIIALLILLGFLFMRIHPRERNRQQTPTAQVLLSEDEDIIQNQNIQELIQQALKNQNYRLAIRYYYLYVLKELSDKEHIHWESQKTNTDYIAELTNTPLQQQFSKITKLYDFIWYGSFEVDEQAYQAAAIQFQSLTQKLTS